MSGSLSWDGPATRAGPTITSRGPFAISVALAIVVHAALFYRSHALAHGERLMALPASMVVRIVPVESKPNPPDISAAAMANPAPSQSQAETPTQSPTPSESRGERPSQIGTERPSRLEMHAAAASNDLSTATMPTPRATAAVPPLPPARVDLQRPALSASTGPAVAPGERLADPDRRSASKAPDAPPAAQGLPAAPDYLMAAQMDPGPQPLGDIDPEYPEAAEMRSGSVVLRLLISETGNVDNVAVVRAIPPGLFERSALAAFGSAKFSPGKMLGLPVKSQLTVEVQFTPLNRGARVSGRGY